MLVCAQVRLCRWPSSRRRACASPGLHIGRSLTGSILAAHQGCRGAEKAAKVEGGGGGWVRKRERVEQREYLCGGCGVMVVVMACVGRGRGGGVGAEGGVMAGSHYMSRSALSCLFMVFTFRCAPPVPVSAGRPARGRAALL